MKHEGLNHEGQLGRRAAVLGLALLLAWTAGWSAWAVLSDGRITPTDSTLHDSFRLALAVRQGSVVNYLAESRKGPLAGALVFGLDLLVADPLHAARLLNVLAHLVLLVLVANLAERLSGSRGAGLLAAWLCAVYVGIYGWCRMDYHEPLIAVALLGALRLMIAPLGPGVAAGLGLVVGLGVLVKTGFLVFLLPPALLYLVRHCRSRTGAAYLGLALLVALLLAAAWWMPLGRDIWTYASGSATFGLPAAERMRVYREGLPGSDLLLGAGLAGAFLCGRLRPQTRLTVALLALAGCCSGVLLIAWFDPWPRYLVPALPPCAVLGAAGLHALADRLPRRPWRPVAAAVAVLGLAALTLDFVRTNLAGGERSRQREGGAGMIAPDRRPFRAYPTLADDVRRSADPALMPFGWPPAAMGYASDVPLLWRGRGHDLPLLDPQRALARLARGESVTLVLTHPREADPLRYLAWALERDPGPDPALREVAAGSRRVLRTYLDPAPFGYSLILVTPDRARARAPSGA